MGFNFFKKKKEPKDIGEVLAKLREMEASFNNLSGQLEDLKKRSRFNIQKFGIIRYNPFKETGGNQSFSLCLLDGNDEGVVITSLYTKEGNRVYGKPIEKGESRYSLSGEEKKAIEIAKENGKRKPKLDNPAAGGGRSGTH